MGSAVVLARDDVGVSHEAALEVRTNGGHEDHEQILVSRFHTHAGARADQQRTEIERSASLVRRDEVGVETDDLLDGFPEQPIGNLGHHDALCRTLQTLAVLVPAEHTHFAVLAAEGLHAFEGFLTIVQAGGSHVDVNRSVGADFQFAPFAVAEIAADVVIRWIITEC